MPFIAAMVAAPCTNVRRGSGYKARKGGGVRESIRYGCGGRIVHPTGRTSTASAKSLPGREPLERVVRNQGTTYGKGEETDSDLSHPGERDGNQEGSEQGRDEPTRRDDLHED